MAFDAARMAPLRRDAEAEAKARARLDELGVRAIPPTSRPLPPPEGAHLAMPRRRLPTIVAALVAEGWQVEAAGRTYRRAGGVAGRACDRASTGSSSRASVDFERRCRARSRGVLEALRRGDDRGGARRRIARPPAGGVARAARDLAAARRRARGPGALREEPGAAARRAARRASPGCDVDEAFARARDAIADRGATSRRPIRRRASHGELRGYQREGLGWLRFLDRTGFGGLLADDMGLGKTVQVLALLAGSRGRPSLVVAPRSLIFNWKREAARFAPDAARPRPHGRREARRAAAQLRGSRRGPHHLRHAPPRRRRARAAWSFDYVVLDEAQAIKNDASETARAARRLHADHRLALSGTPVENHLGELWSIVEFLNPGMLGRAAAWKARRRDARPSPDAVALLGRALRPFLLRRTKREVAPDLPARTGGDRGAASSTARRRALYEELRDRFRAEVLGEGARGRDRRRRRRGCSRRCCACGRRPATRASSIPTRRGERSAKLDALLPSCSALRESGPEGAGVLAVPSLLSIVREPQLEAEGHRLRAARRRRRRDRRRRGRRASRAIPAAPCFLVSLKAGGVGLNLTAAEYVFLLDPWWNPAAEAQAIDRAHRIGQTRRCSPTG